MAHQIKDFTIFLHTESGEMIPVIIDSHDWNDWFFVKQKDGEGATFHVRSCDLYTNCRRLLSSYGGL